MSSYITDKKVESDLRGSHESCSNAVSPSALGP